MAECEHGPIQQEALDAIAELRSDINIHMPSPVYYHSLIDKVERFISLLETINRVQKHGRA